MSFRLIKKLENGVRIGELETPHGTVHTPFFMPVGTVGSVKSVSPDELEKLGAEIMLSNTYHLYLRPGEELIKELGGLHKFIGWDKPILTDSGGYQVFSLGENKIKNQISKVKIKENYSLNLASVLAKNNHSLGVIPAKAGISKIPGQARDDKSSSLVKITEEGVEFKSHLDGSKHLFTPEKVIDIQLDLGVDILMPLDVCPSGKATKKEVEEAVRLTIEWARRSKLHFDKKISIVNNQQPFNSQISTEQNGNLADCKLTANCKLQTANFMTKLPMLHGIVQGGLFPDLREKCAKALIDLDFDGYSVGGLAVDLETRDMWEIVKQMGEILPENKQRYLMGVGTPDDIIMATHRGMDMFDCVLPTRMARHGSVYVKAKSSKQKEESDQSYISLNMMNSQFRTDKNVIDLKCGCFACKNGQGFSRAYIAHLLRSNEILGLRLATLHNLYQYLELMKDLKTEPSI